MCATGNVRIVERIMTEMGMQRTILEMKASGCYKRMEQPIKAAGGEVRPRKGRKSNLRHSPVKAETPSAYAVG